MYAPGDKVRNWTLIRHYEANGERRAGWYCRCDCGNEAQVQTCDLTMKTSTTCRKCTGHMMAKVTISEGMRIDGWRVVRCLEPGATVETRTWLIECRCGYLARRDERAVKRIVKEGSPGCAICARKATK